MSVRVYMCGVCAKPTNACMLNISTDFGMSRAVGHNEYYTTDDKSIPVKWCAPEVLEYGKFSTQSDCWAFGVVLWEVFSYGKVLVCPKFFCVLLLFVYGCSLTH